MALFIFPCATCAVEDPYLGYGESEGKFASEPPKHEVIGELEWTVAVLVRSYGVTKGFGTAYFSDTRRPIE